MAEFFKKLGSTLRKNLRTVVQFCWTALTNGYAAGFAKGTIYTGSTKQFCVPGLNCYSCPGALGACPIGSFQAVMAGRDHKFPFYVAGFLIMVGAFCGRFVCGWLCPFGLVQDLVYKIPFFKKLHSLPGERWLRRIKYVILVGFVIVLPMVVVDVTGLGKPWFCKYICPSGTLLGGIPLALGNPALRSVLGWLFTWKFAILVLLLLLSLLVYRPFCRYLCPLGAIYGAFNPVALYRFQVDKDACTNCGACKKVCPMDISTCDTPNSVDCIRCGKCLSSCPHAALSSTFKVKKKQK